LGGLCKKNVFEINSMGRLDCVFFYSAHDKNEWNLFYVYRNLQQSTQTYYLVH